MFRRLDRSPMVWFLHAVGQVQGQGAVHRFIRQTTAIPGGNGFDGARQAADHLGFPRSCTAARRSAGRNDHEEKHSSGRIRPSRLSRLMRSARASFCFSVRPIRWGNGEGGRHRRAPGTGTKRPRPTAGEGSGGDTSLQPTGRALTGMLLRRPGVEALFQLLAVSAQKVTFCMATWLAMFSGVVGMSAVSSAGSSSSTAFLLAGP